MASEHGEEAGEEGGDDISLDEVLDEMDEEEEDELDETKHKHYKHMEEAKKKKVDFAEPKGHTKGSGYGDEKREDKGSMGKKGAALKGAEKEAKFTPAHKELEEAKRALNIMRKELNEINLLNAKLLYTNKIFKSKSLSESQKVKVLSAFDRATTVKETKNVYNTLMESLQVSKKTSLKESYGFASKPAGNSPTKNMVESDPFVTRMQKLAGLI